MVIVMVGEEAIQMFAFLRTGYVLTRKFVMNFPTSPCDALLSFLFISCIQLYSTCLKESAKVMELINRRGASQGAPDCLLARCSSEQKHVAGEIGLARAPLFCSCVTVPPL